MSWKSFVTAGLLCALATPVFAAPTVQVVPGGTFANNHLNADGDWVWTVRLSQSNPIVDLTGIGGITSAGSPLAAELGFTESASELLGATVNATDFDDPNPGNVIFGWETLTNLGGTGACDSATPGNCPVGLQTDLTVDQIFAAFGSVDYGTDADGKDFLTIVIDGPSTTGSLTTNLQMSGAYGSDQGRIAELNPAYDGDGTPPASLNYDTYSGAFSRTAKAGDANLDNSVGAADYNTWLGNVGIAGAKWYQADFNGDASVGAADYNIWLGNVGAGSGGGSGVPEPASLALVGLGILAVGGTRFRNR